MCNWSSRRKEKKGGTEKILEELSLKTSQICQRKWKKKTKHVNFQIQEAEQTQRRKKTKKSPTRCIIVKVMKIEYKEKNIWKQQKRTKSKPLWKTPFKLQWISQQEQVEARASCITFSSINKRTVNPESNVQWKYFSEVKGKSRHSQKQEN